MSLKFQKATKRAVKVRIGLIGPSGSGKTMTALRIAMGLVPGGRIAVIDTEGESARLYVGEEVPEGVIGFDVLELDEYHPDRFTEALQVAGKAGYDVIIVDSLSHAWEGALAEVDKVAKRSRSGSSFNAWGDVTPMHNQLVQTILRSPAHVIATMRAKTEFLVDQSGGKTKIKKVGLAPVQRKGMEYEFTIVADIDLDTHSLMVSKTRMRSLDGKVVREAGGDLGKEIADWLGQGKTGAEELADALASTPADLDRDEFEEWSHLKGKGPLSEYSEAQLHAAAGFIRGSVDRIIDDLNAAHIAEIAGVDPEPSSNHGSAA